MTAPLDEARLRELAEAATPGEWQHMKGRDIVRAMRGDFCIPLVEVLEPYGDPLLDAPTCRVGKEVVFRANSQGAKDSAAMKQAFQNAAFIAAANPATITALLDALSAERERADRAVEYIAKEIHAGRDFVGKREWAKGTNRKYYRRQAEKILAAPGREWKYG